VDVSASGGGFAIWDPESVPQSKPAARTSRDSPFVNNRHSNMTLSSNEHLGAVASKPAHHRWRRAHLWQVVSLCLFTVALHVIGCGSPAPETSEVEIEMTLQPSPPVVGDANVRL